MRYEIMGPLRVIDHGHAWSVGSRKVETVLGVLLIRAGRVVTVDQLIAEVWNDQEPDRAVAGIHVLVSQLRKFLARCGAVGDPVETRPSGYSINILPDELDLSAFEHFFAAGQAYVRQEMHEEAVESLGSALDLWRGPVLDRVSEGAIVQAFIAWAAETHLTCQEMFTDSRLALGRHRELVGELYALVAEFPLREPFYRQLMLALYGGQRKADALRAYQTARMRLNEELGLEPGPELQEVRRAILREDVPLQRLATARP